MIIDKVIIISKIKFIVCVLIAYTVFLSITFELFQYTLSRTTYVCFRFKNSPAAVYDQIDSRIFKCNYLDIVDI